jgi:hypothetical protein
LLVEGLGEVAVAGVPNKDDASVPDAVVIGLVPK